LEVPLSQLLEGLDVKPKMVKTAPAERSEVRRDEQCSTIRYFSLSREFLNRQMDPFILEVMPGEGRAEGKCHPGEEFLMVTRGALSLFYGEEEVPLKQGDSIYFNSMVPHRLWNAGSEPAEVLCVFLLRDDGRSW
jgi:mannose-6-phosphate isomerase-like protein (cupin superfamily)